MLTLNFRSGFCFPLPVTPYSGQVRTSLSWALGEGVNLLSYCDRSLDQLTGVMSDYCVMLVSTMEGVCSIVDVLVIAWTGSAFVLSLLSF